VATHLYELTLRAGRTYTALELSALLKAEVTDLQMLKVVFVEHLSSYLVNQK
jgi:hypothetical protein